MMFLIAINALCEGKEGKEKHPVNTILVNTSYEHLIKEFSQFGKGR
jgi:hypothetical protein